MIRMKAHDRAQRTIQQMRGKNTPIERKPRNKNVKENPKRKKTQDEGGKNDSTSREGLGDV